MIVVAARRVDGTSSTRLEPLSLIAAKSGLILVRLERLQTTPHH